MKYTSKEWAGGIFVGLCLLGITFLGTFMYTPWGAALTHSVFFK